MRTHYCGEVDERLTGTMVLVAGWVHRRRDHGGVIFIDLRDREGLVQVVCHPEREALFAIAEKLRNEFVLQVRGSVRARPEGTINPTSRAAAIEIAAEELTLLNRSDPLPFQLDETVSEEVRLRYRYLDLRREVMNRRLRLRHRLTRAMRSLSGCPWLHRYRDPDADQGDARRGRATTWCRAARIRANSSRCRSRRSCSSSC